MNINQVFLIIQIGLIPSIYSLLKTYYREKSFRLFYIYIIVSYLTEVITNRLINGKHYLTSHIIANFYMLFEYVIITTLIEKISKPNAYFKILNLFIVGVWLIENTYIHKIYESSQYFNSISALFLFLILIYALTINLNINYKSYFKEARIVINITLLFNVTFRIVFEYLYYNYETNIAALQAIGNVNILVNLITNILFIYSLTCIKNRKRLISSF